MSFKSFFCPDSVAIIGASREKGKVGHAVLDNVIDSGYKGELFLINPNADEIHNIKCYKSILDVPQDVDLVIIAIPGSLVSKALEECLEKNVKWAIIISAGFKETGIKGAKMEKRLVEKARDFGIRILGPNCLGMIDLNCPINASFSPNMPKKGEISFLSQSGALGTSVLDWSKANKVGFSKFVSLGNKADISENDLFDAWADDDTAKVITAYIEGVKDGREFMRMANKLSRKKPLIVVKAGNTDAGAKAVSSHTGTLAGSSRAYDAAFKQSGIIRAKTVRDLFDYAISFSYQPLPKGEKVAIITNAGGPGIMATDACENNNIPLANLENETIERLKQFLPPAANLYNPVDILGDALSDRYKKTLEVIIKDKNVDAIIIILTPQGMTQSYETAKKIVEVLENTEDKKTVFTCFMGGAEVRRGINYLMKNRIPNFDIPEVAVDALKAMIDYNNWLSKKARSIEEFEADESKVKTLFDKSRSEERDELGEIEARGVLEAYNIKLPESEFARDINEAKEIAKKIGYPLVLKVVSPNILHKTDVGGVVINIKNNKQLEENFDQILWNVKKYMSDANIKGMLVQEMIESKKETIIGVSRDNQFGPVIMFGLGGIYVEALKDVSFRIAPVSRLDAKEMIDEIKAIKLLKGTRGEKPSDINCIIDTILKVSQLVMDFSEIIEMDINPLFVKEEGKGCIAGDVRIRIGG